MNKFSGHLHKTYLKESTIIFLMATMMISPTAISSYLYCPRKLFLERILGLFKYPKEAMVKGTIKHEIFEDINNKEKEIVTSIKEKLSEERLLNLYRKEYSIIARKKILKHSKELDKFKIDNLEFFQNFWPTLLNEAETRSKSVFDFIEEHNLFGDELWEKLTPKIISELRISDSELGVRGIIDELRDYGNLYVPVELKSGKSPEKGVWPGHKSQIALYMMILKGQGKTVKEGIIKYIDEKKEVTIQLNTLLEDESKKQLILVRTLLQEKKLPERIDSFNKCSACQLKEDCYNDKFIEEKMKEKKLIS
jgi:CRISPR-associated protein Cas4